MPTSYDLATVEGFDLRSLYRGDEEEDNVANMESLKLNVKTWRHNDSNYRIIRYEKDYLTFDRVKSSGLFRSVICKNGKILVFSPPKAMASERFTELYRAGDCKAEEFIEGTMINLFFDTTNGSDSEWEIATKSSVGAKMGFFSTGEATRDKTFRQMFLESCNDANLDFDQLDKELCYTFVFQHPGNRIVAPFTQTGLYIVACHAIDSDSYKITETSLDDVKGLFQNTSVRLPTEYDFETYDDLRDTWASSNTDYKHVGVVLRHKDSGVRTKFRNPNYVIVRRLRGNQPKLQYQYLVLRQQGKVKDYLRYFREYQTEFAQFRDQIHGFTGQLHQNYMKCYVRKEKPLREFPYQFRTHMYNLHQTYINELRVQNLAVTRNVVIDHINNMPPAKLMFSLNYSMRQNQIEEIVAEN